MTVTKQKKPNDRWLEAERRYHNDHAAAYVEKYGRSYAFQIPEALFLFPYIGERPTGRMLEIACGPAISLPRFLAGATHSLQYIGLDLSGALLGFARANLPEGSFLIGDGSRIPLSPSSVDHVLVLGGLHHIPDLTRTLQSIFTVLRPGGHLLLREPSVEAFKDRWEGDTEHERGLSPQEIEEIAQKQGGTVLSIRRFNSRIFHGWRTFLHQTRLYKLVEPIEAYWHMKTRCDETLSRKYGERWPALLGLDFCMVIQKEPA